MAPESRDEVRQRIASLYDQAENDTGNFNATRAMAARTRSRGVPLAKRTGRRPDPGLEEIARQWFDAARAKLGPTVPAALPADRLPDVPVTSGRSWGRTGGPSGGEREVRALPAGGDALALTGGERPALPSAERPEALERGAGAVAELTAGSPVDPPGRPTQAPQSGQFALPGATGPELPGHAVALPGAGTAEPGDWGTPGPVSYAALPTAAGPGTPGAAAQAPWATAVQGEPGAAGPSATPALPPTGGADLSRPEAPGLLPTGGADLLWPEAPGLLPGAAMQLPGAASAQVATGAALPMAHPVPAATGAPVEMATGVAVPLPATAPTHVPAGAAVQLPGTVTAQVPAGAAVQLPRTLPGTDVPGRLSPTASKSGARWKLDRARDLLSLGAARTSFPGIAVQPEWAPGTQEVRQPAVAEATGQWRQPQWTATPATDAPPAAPIASLTDTGSLTALTATGSYAVPAAAPAAAPAPESPRALRAAKAIAFARAQIGKPCVWGAMGPGSYDCSSLTQAAWRAAGVTLPRAAHEQALAGTPVTLAGIEPGDLVLFFDDDRHVGLHVGDGMMVHAPGPGSSVREESVYGAGEAAIHRIVRPA
ncbi:C40 family peptidase [Streptomyces sp. NRRL B-3648]|uniref:C40 family peptidase n=1 Tax=Streptomyces sp. NRRL B-3648 TaxID=1519493 RepID=UPI0006B032F7|nr:C40 family peptidase [Streptomyces sp. NRRL B-3648]